MSESPDPPSPAPPPRHAPEQGLASLFLGAVVFVTAPLIALIAFVLRPGVPVGKVQTLFTEWLPRVMSTAPVLLALFGSYLGYRGLNRARLEGGSTALPAAGLLLCLTALLGSVVVACLVYVVVNKL